MLWKYAEEDVNGGDLFKLSDKLNTCGEKLNTTEVLRNSNGHCYIVMDGQQRLSTIKWAFNKDNGLSVSKDSDGKWNIYDKDEKDDQKTYLYEYETNEELKEKINKTLIIGYKCNSPKFDYDTVIDIFKNINLGAKPLNLGTIFTCNIGKIGKNTQNFFKKLSKIYNPNILIGLALLLSGNKPSVKLTNLNDTTLKNIADKFENDNDNIREIYKKYLEFFNDKEKEHFWEKAKKYRTSLMCFYIILHKFKTVENNSEHSIKYLLLLLTLSVGKANSQGIIEDFYVKFITKHSTPPPFKSIVEYFKTDVNNFIEDVIETNDTDIQRFILFSISGNERKLLHGFDLDHIHPKSKFSVKEWVNFVGNKQLISAHYNRKKNDSDLCDYMKEKNDVKNLPQIAFDPTADNADIDYSNEKAENFYNARKDIIKKEIKEYFEL